MLREKSLPMAEKEVENERIAGYIKAVSQWLFHKPLYETSFNNFGDLSMDYLVQMIISGDNVSFYSNYDLLFSILGLNL